MSSVTSSQVSDIIIPAILVVWGQIAGDFPSDVYPATEVVELASDAGRLENAGFSQASDLIDVIMQENDSVMGYKLIASQMPHALYESWQTK